MNYDILYIVKKRGLNVIETTMCEGSELANVIKALQSYGYTIFAAISTNKEF